MLTLHEQRLLDLFFVRKWERTMITKLSLENFKGFKYLEVPETSTITLIGGQNNIGKTSLLEGIFLFYDVGNPGDVYAPSGMARNKCFFLY